MLDNLMEKGLSLKTIQLLIKNRKRALGLKRDINILDKKIKTTEETNLQEIKGIGPATIKKLLESGIKTQEELKKTGFEKIKEIIKSPISLKVMKNIFNK